MSVTHLDPLSLIFTLDEALTQAECRSLIAETEAIGYQAAPITTAFGPVLNTEVRDNTRVRVDDEARAEWLWERVAAHIPPEIDGWEVVGLNERFRFYRYEPNQYFRWHYDGHYQRSSGERSLLTLLVYLNEDMEGGATQFDMLGSVYPEEGLALVFEHRILHQGNVVLEGTKYVMRTDVMYRRQV